jgi:hypothetical protein
MKLQHPTSTTINQQVEVKSTKGKKKYHTWLNID